MLIEKKQYANILAIVDVAEDTSLAVVHRAAELSKASGASLAVGLVHQQPSYMERLFGLAEKSMSGDEERLLATSEKVRDLTGKAGIVPQLHSLSVDGSELDAILRLIDDIRPDVVCKASESNTYILGAMPHLDWSLVRESQASLWFVEKQENSTFQPLRAAPIVAAVDRFRSEGEESDGLDFSVMAHAGALAEMLGGEVHLAHAYEVPHPVQEAHLYTPGLGPEAPFVSPLSEQALSEELRAVAKKHGEVIRAYADYCSIDPKRVHVHQGRPASVFPALVEAAGAQLIVIGAHDHGRWQRVQRATNAEAVLEEAMCDVLVVKEGG